MAGNFRFGGRLDNEDIYDTFWFKGLERGIIKEAVILGGRGEMGTFS